MNSLQNMINAITLINKEFKLENGTCDDYVMDRVWEIIRVRWQPSFIENVPPTIEYRIEVLCQAIANISIEIERLLKEKNKKK